MSLPYENELREQLANHLDLIEPGLCLVGTEHPIANAKGTRGRIDILARDRHRSWVVIELKRSDSTARQALHEVTKYTELLRREEGLRQDRIRAVIVSTTWDELLVPVSNLARDWSHNLRGYHLVVGTNGELARADRVELLSAPSVPEVTPIQFIYFFDTEEERDRGWQCVVNRAAEAGANDLLAADIRRVRDFEFVRAPLGLYFTIGRIDPAQVPSQTAEAASNSNEAPGFELEYQALCHITRHVFGAGYESAVPGVLRQIYEDDRWVIEGYRSAGEFGKRNPLSAHDLLRDLNGDDLGIAQVLFTGSARTTDRGRWTTFLDEYRTSLSYNEDWTVLVDHWLTDVAAAPTESDVVLHVYNPGDLIAALVHGWPDDLQPQIPALYGVAYTRTGPHRTIYGTLYWDGNPIPNLDGRAAHIYREPINWATARSYGDNRRRDTDLIESLGLRYMLIEKVGDDTEPPTTDDAITLWMVRDGHVNRITRPFAELAAEGWRGLYPVSYFFEKHRDQLDALVTRYRQALSIEPSSSTKVDDDRHINEADLDHTPIEVRHNLPAAEASPPETDLKDCDVTARERVPVDAVAQSLTTITKLRSTPFERQIAFLTCAANGGAAAIAAQWLVDTLGAINPDIQIVPEDTGMPNLRSVTRSDYIVATCYVVGLKTLPVELRRRAANQLVAFCGDTGYAEARRLLREKEWTWLPGALKVDAWGGLLATYVIHDESVPNKTRESITLVLDEVVRTRAKRLTG